MMRAGRPKCLTDCSGMSLFWQQHEERGPLGSSRRRARRGGSPATHSSLPRVVRSAALRPARLGRPAKRRRPAAALGWMNGASRRSLVSSAWPTRKLFRASCRTYRCRCWKALCTDSVAANQEDPAINSALIGPLNCPGGAPSGSARPAGRKLPHIPPRRSQQWYPCSMHSRLRVAAPDALPSRPKARSIGSRVTVTRYSNRQNSFCLPTGQGINSPMKETLSIPDEQMQWTLSIPSDCNPSTSCADWRRGAGQGATHACRSSSEGILPICVWLRCPPIAEMLGPSAATASLGGQRAVSSGPGARPVATSACRGSPTAPTRPAEDCSTGPRAYAAAPESLWARVAGFPPPSAARMRAPPVVTAVEAAC
jgi:hypothetical protein